MDRPYDELNILYTQTLEDIIVRFFQILLDENQFSIIIDSHRHKADKLVKKTSPFFIDEIKIYIRVHQELLDSDSDDSLPDIIKQDNYDDKQCFKYVRLIYSHEIFMNELKLQQNVLPKIEIMLQTKVIPELFHYSDQFRIFLIEDLLNQGYQVKSFERGLNLNDCTEAIKLMAKLHAASVALHEQDPDLIEAFKIEKLATEKNCEHLMRIFRNTMTKVIAFMNTTYPLIAAAMECLLHKIYTMKQIIKLFTYEPEEFCVLNNGNFSTSNLIFPEATNVPLLLQNYQMATYSSPAIDLHYFLKTSGETATVIDQDKILLDTYLYTLKNTMQTLNCKTQPPTMKELKAAMKKRKLYAVFASMTFRLSVMMDKVEENTENSDRDKNSWEELAKKMCLTMFHKKYYDYRCISYIETEV